MLSSCVYLPLLLSHSLCCHTHTLCLLSLEGRTKAAGYASLVLVAVVHTPSPDDVAVAAAAAVVDDAVGVVATSVDVVVAVVGQAWSSR